MCDLAQERWRFPICGSGFGLTTRSRIIPTTKSSWQVLRALTRDHKGTIETKLPSGQTLAREVEADQLLAGIAADTVCVVFGESGSGKSALVKTLLGERFPGAAQVWFGPENLESAVNEATHAGIGIDRPLIEVLNASSSADNFLVIDAAERLSGDSVSKAKALIEDLRNRNASCETEVWRILIVGQTEAWISGMLQELAGAVSPESFEVEGLPVAAVADVLQSVAGLEWLATHSDAVAALTNLRTLAWVIQAAVQFRGQESGVSLSLTAIADRLWIHWTDNKPSIQRLLVRLAEREAEFEHSFAISELESGDATVLDALPIACPLRRDETSGRIRFQHNLAADWARYQRLKEIAGDTSKWAQFAANPFWHGALRMLGQLLLRQNVETRSAWDVAFEAAEQKSGSGAARRRYPLGGTIPRFECRGRSLTSGPTCCSQMEGRGCCVLSIDSSMFASVPGLSRDMRGLFGDLNLYIEAHFRTPIFARWPAMAQFLAKYRDTIAEYDVSCDRAPV